MSVYERHGKLVRLLYLLTAMVAYIPITVARFTANKKAVLCYHGVLSVQKLEFKRQMAYLARYCRKFPKIDLTFDDAFDNLLKNALPVLEEYQQNAVIFAVSGNLGEKPTWSMLPNHPEANETVMTAEQLQALSKHPLIRVGSHTQTHPDLSQLPPDRIRWELTESKRNLEYLLSHPVDDLALPHGAFNDTVLQIAREVGYKRIYTLEPRLMPKDTIDEGVIGRFSMSPEVWPIEFFLTCAGAYAWLFPWRTLIGRVRGIFSPQ